MRMGQRRARPNGPSVQYDASEKERHRDAVTAVGKRYSDTIYLCRTATAAVHLSRRHARRRRRCCRCFFTLPPSPPSPSPPSPPSTAPPWPPWPPLPHWSLPLPLPPRLPPCTGNPPATVLARRSKPAKDGRRHARHRSPARPCEAARGHHPCGRRAPRWGPRPPPTPRRPQSAVSAWPPPPAGGAPGGLPTGSPSALWRGRKGSAGVPRGRPPPRPKGGARLGDAPPPPAASIGARGRAGGGRRRAQTRRRPACGVAASTRIPWVNRSSPGNVRPRQGPRGGGGEGRGAPASSAPWGPTCLPAHNQDALSTHLARTAASRSPRRPTKRYRALP